MQTTLLGLAIAFIIALLAALIGPYYIDWNQFRPQFEAEAGKIIGVPVRVAGELDARLLPAPTLRLRGVKRPRARPRLVHVFFTSERSWSSPSCSISAFGSSV